MKKIVSKKLIFDRIEQSFELFKGNFIKLFLPLFLYTFFTAIVFVSVWTSFLVSFWEDFFNNIINNNWYFFNKIPEILIMIFVASILLILYVILYIPFLLATIKGIKQAYNGEKIKNKENIEYWIKNTFNSFRTYWYIFAYVMLIPALILIVLGLFLIYGLNNNNYELINILLIIGIIFLPLVILFLIYRWTKSSFALYSAVDKEEYTVNNFKKSIKIVKNKWWRIFGNFLLVSLMLWLLIWVLKKIISLFVSNFDIWIKTIINLKENPETIYTLILEILSTYSPIKNFILNTLEGFINIIATIFVMIFTYILYKRLEIEYSNEKKEL